MNDVRDERITMLDFANIAMRSIDYLIILPLLAVAFVIGAELVGKDEYTAISVFVPENRPASGTQLAGLAAQLGVNLGSQSEGEPVKFYTSLLRSREILSSAVTTEYPVSAGAGDSSQSTWLDIYKIEGSSTAERLRNGIDHLQDRMSISSDLETGFVKVEVAALSPELAVAVNRRLLELLNEFNLDRRKSQAAAEREFVGGRLREARESLDSAELALETFFAQNRRYDESPQLTFEAARLQREVDFAQQLYTALAQDYERARFAEIRDTPIINIIDSPEGSAEIRSSFVARLIIALLIGLLGAAVYSLLREAIRRNRLESPDAYAEFQALRLATRSRIQRMRFIRKGEPEA